MPFEPSILYGTLFYPRVPLSTLQIWEGGGLDIYNLLTKASTLAFLGNIVCYKRVITTAVL